MKKYLLSILCALGALCVAADNPAADVGNENDNIVVLSTSADQMSTSTTQMPNTGGSMSYMVPANVNHNSSTVVDHKRNVDQIFHGFDINGGSGRVHTPITPPGSGGKPRQMASCDNVFDNTGDDSGDDPQMAMSNGANTSELLRIIIDYNIIHGGGGRIVTPIDPRPGKPGQGTNLKEVAGTCINLNSLDSEGSDNQGGSLWKRYFSNISLIKLPFEETNGGGGKKPTPIGPGNVSPNIVIPPLPSVSSSKESIENVTDLIDYLLINGPNEDVGIEDVTNMIDRLLVK